MSEFLRMGDYGFYVWSSYAIFFVVLMADALAPWLRKRSIVRQLRSRYQREQNRRSVA